jgi:hypothetical protein
MPLLTHWYPTLPAMQPNTAAGLFLDVEVADSGPGIPEQKRCVARRRAAPRTEVRTPVNTRLFVNGDAQRLQQVVTTFHFTVPLDGPPVLIAGSPSRDEVLHGRH